MELEEKEVGYDGLKDYISGVANRNYIYKGEIDHGFGWAGQGVAGIEDIPSVKELIERMIAEAEEIRKQWKE